MSKSGNPRPGNPEVSECDLAWLAGIMDGEGSIAAYYDKRASRRVPRLKISVANTDWLMLARVKDLWHRLTGRHYKMCEKTPQPTNRKRQWQIFINRRASIRQIMEAVFPYLTVKRRAAWGAIEMMRCTWHRGEPIPTRMFEYARFIQKANQFPSQPGDGSRLETVETGRHQIAATLAGFKGQSEPDGNIRW